MKVLKNLVPQSKWGIKCPYSMKPECVVIHNTYNDASALNEVRYMVSNDNTVSFHYAVDDREVVQGIPEDRNSWNAGDGRNGEGNRKGISIEICYSKSGGERFLKAERNAARFTAEILKVYGWGIDRVKKHKDFSGKYCPHRTLDLGWERFLNMVKKELIVTGKVKEELNVTDRNYYRDKPSSWALKAWEKASKKGIVDGKRPKCALTREEFCVVLERLGVLDDERNV